MRPARLLLVLAPPLSLAHVLAIRGGHVRPGWTPVVVVALLPAGALVMALRCRPRPLGTIALAALELAWSAVYAAMVGIAIGIRSG